MKTVPLISLGIVITDHAVTRYGETMMPDISPCSLRDYMARAKLEQMISSLDGVDIVRQSVRVDGIRLVISHKRLVYAGAAVNFVPFRPQVAKAESLA